MPRPSWMWIYLSLIHILGISDVETIGIDTPEDLTAAEEFLKRMKR